MPEILRGTICAQFESSAERFFNRPFLHIPLQACKKYSPSAIEFTYQEMLAEVQNLVCRYGEAGYGTGYRVALLLENRAEFFQHFLALNALGACVVPINPDNTVSEMAYVIENSKISLLVCLPEYVDKAGSAVESSRSPVKIAWVDEQSLPGPSCKRDAGTQQSVGGLPAAILYTSGTTGKPKGCVLSNDFFFCVGNWYVGIKGHLSMDEGSERAITPLPLFHTNALTWTMMAMMMNGGCIIQLDRFHPSSWWETVRDSKATIIHYLGVMPAMLMGMEKTDAEYNPGIKFGFGAGVEPDLHARFEERFGFPLIEGWSMTETGAAGVVMCTEDPRHVGQRCMGRAAQGMEFKVVDDTGMPVSPGEAGEFLVRRLGKDPRYGFFTEYFGNPAATEEAWKGGWFHTGDVVRANEEGILFFIERKKNIIRRSGENIAAMEVESVLLDCAGVVNCAVAPVPDPIREEEVAACIILDEGTSPNKETAEGIVRFCLEKISYFKVPGYIYFSDRLPLTSTQKIQRGELRKLCLELYEKEFFLDFRSAKKKNH